MKHYILVEVRTARDRPEDPALLLTAMRKVRQALHELELPSGTTLADGFVRGDWIGSYAEDIQSRAKILMSRLMPRTR